MPWCGESNQRGRDIMKGAESVVGQGLVIEGKVEGNGSIRLLGRLKGHVAVSGDVTVDPDGSVEGEVRADRVRIAGHAEATIVAQSAIELARSASLVGDVKAPTVQVTAGAKMRGSVDSGWNDKDGSRRAGAVGDSNRSPDPTERGL
jgi:cytoskeletal protein CcmA (bactofilin family)